MVNSQHNVMKIVVITLFLISAFTLQAQQKAIEPLFLGRFEYGGSSADSHWEYGFNISLQMNENPSSNLVIRLCTKDQMSVAIATAAVDPLAFSRFLASSQGKRAIEPNRIFVDRSEDCDTESSTVAITELWLVAGNSGLPKSKEMIEVSRISKRQVKVKGKGAGDILIGTRCHKVALKYLLNQLRMNPLAHGVVLGYFVEEPSETIEKKLRFAAEFLRDKELEKDNRITIRPNSWTGFREIEEPEFLSVFLITIRSNSAKIENEEEVIWIDR